MMIHRSRISDIGRRIKNKKEIIYFFPISVFCLLISCFFIGCGQKIYKDTQFSMGSFVEVISPDPRAKVIVFEEFNKLESLFNLFDENSELSHLNSSGTFVVSPEMLEILKASRKFYEATQGAFDPTVGPLSLLWKKAIHAKSLPSVDDVKKLLDLVGFDYVYLDEKSNEVRLMKEGEKIDLGGIAKGFAVDQSVIKLRQAGVTSAIVNSGGNMYCLGDNNKKLWEVGIADPRLREHLIKKLALKNQAIATSGDYEQFFEFQNKRYSHIIDPKSGYPADSGIASATVIAPSATTADALATAFVVLGKDKSRDILRNFPQTHAILIDVHGRIDNL